MSRQIIGDYHLHSSFSGDSDTPMEDVIRKGTDMGFTIMCITEHLDMDFPESTGLDFSLDMESYYNKFSTLREKYKPLLDLRFGVELGLQPHLAARHREFIQEYPFDFIIGSSHIADGIDPYYPEFYEGRTEDEAYRSYFESILENLNAFSDVDVYGHIDYVVRYGPNKNRFYSYKKFSDIIDAILQKIIDKGLGIECNTGGIKYGLGHPNPCEDILTRYRELGGEILTIGSDAHTPKHVGYAFGQLPELLKSCGFTHYTIFKDRKAEFIPL